MKHHFKELLKLAYKYKKQHVYAFFFMSVSSLLVLLPPYLTMKIIDDGIMRNDIYLLIKMAVFLLVVCLVQGICKLSSDYIYSTIGKKMIATLRIKILNHLQNLSGVFYSNMKSGEIITKIQVDLSNLENIVTRMAFLLTSEVIMAVTMLIVLSMMQLDLLIMSLILQPIMLIMQIKLNKRLKILVGKSRENAGKMFSLIRDFLSSLMQFNAILNAKKYFFNRYIFTERNYIKQGVDVEMTYSYNLVGMNIVGNLSALIIFGYGGYKVITGDLTLGGLIAFNMYSQKLFSPFMKIAQYSMDIQQAKVSVERVFSIFDEPRKIDNSKNIFKINQKAEIEMKNVYFGYSKEKIVLRNMNLRFCPNKVTAIVGATGSGKSTIVNLILRLWDISNGEILLDKINIKDYNLKKLRQCISVVSQEAYLFDDSIYNNIVLSNKNVNNEDVIKAIKIADGYEFINNLPEKLNTNVGERGIKLSGGQKQKISIARAIIKNSSIIIFDEATSSLDNISEQIIQNNLKKFLHNKTTIIIAHRLSTIENADEIFVIDRGEVIENGNHNSLLKKHGSYYDLYMKNIKKSDEELVYP